MENKLVQLTYTICTLCIYEKNGNEYFINEVQGRLGGQTSARRIRGGVGGVGGSVVVDCSHMQNGS